MKKFLAILLSALMLLTFVACGNSSSPTPTDKDDTHEHSFASEWQKDADNHWHACTGDGCEEVSEKAAHTWDEGKITTEPTETEKGTKTYACIVCGQKKTEAIKETAPQTEDEILKYVIDAINATRDYKGSITFNSKENMVASTPNGETNLEETLSSDNIFSFHNDDKLIYSSLSYFSKDAERKMSGKSFFVDGVLYIYQSTSTKLADAEEPNVSNSYTKVIGDAVKEYTDYSEFSQQFLSSFDMYDGISADDTLEDVKSAFNTALPVYLPDLLSEDDDIKPELTITISAAAKDGGYELIVSFVAKNTLEKDSESNVPTTESKILTVTSKIFAKAGKVVSCELCHEQAMKITSEGAPEQNMRQTMSYSLDIAYEFVQDGYDSVEVSLPTNPEDIEVEGALPESYNDMTLNIIIGDYTYDISFEMIDTPQAAYDNVINSIYFSENVSIQLFKDEEMTKEIKRDTVTNEEFWALEHVYVKLSPDITHAIVFEKGSSREEYSKPHKIVSSFIQNIDYTYYPGSTSNHPQCVEAGAFEFDAELLAEDQYEIWINGEKMDPKAASFNLEGGKTYVFEYVMVLTDPVLESN